MSLAIEADPRELCLRINRNSPMGGLFRGDQSRLHPDSRLPWRISPEPFWLTSEQHDVLLRLGDALLAFFRSCNVLYHQSVKGIQPEFIARYLDAGKPERVIDLGRLNRVKSHLPLVMRPDLILTADGVRAVELDSIPGGIGFTGQISRIYSEIGYDVVGGGDGLLRGFHDALTTSLPEMETPTICIVVSDEADNYREEMEWLASALQAEGHPVYCRHPRELSVDDGGILIRIDGQPRRVNIVYRFFEMFDLANIPKIELVAYHAKKNAVRVSPPMKAYLEEKMWLALFHHPQLQEYWDRELDRDSRALLQAVLPQSWVVDSTPAPPHTVISDLQISGRPVNDWEQLRHLSKREREFVLKPSGFSEDAQQSRGVTVGHDVPEEEWAGALDESLQSFVRRPAVLQAFYKGTRLPGRYYDFVDDEIKQMHGRVLLRPYYFVVGNEVRLSGIQCILCPADKKILHGMTDAILVPAAVREPEASAFR